MKNDLERMGEEHHEISEQEAAIYDRQIRLWGVEAQRRMRSSMVLFCGFKGLNAEICKNLVLAGVSVGIQDSEKVAEVDLGANFFLRSDSVGQNRAEAAKKHVEELNPLVTVKVLTKEVGALDEAALEGYTLVCMSNGTMDERVKLNELCRKGNKGFFVAETFGFNAFMFCDLGKEYSFLAKKFTDTVNADGEKEIVHVKKDISFCSMEEAFGVPLEQLAAEYRVKKRRRGNSPNAFILAVLIGLRVFNKTASGCDESDILETLTSLMDEQGIAKEKQGDFVDKEIVLQTVKALHLKHELSPICATVGGIVGQELIKAISGKDEPINNMFLCEGLTGYGVVRTVAPSATTTK